MDEDGPDNGLEDRIEGCLGLAPRLPLVIILLLLIVPTPTAGLVVLE